MLTREKVTFEMNRYMMEVLERNFGKPMSEDIIPMIKAFFEKAVDIKLQAQLNSEIGAIEFQLKDMVVYLTENTRNYEKMSEEDLATIQKILDELAVLYEEVLKKHQNCTKDIFIDQMTCISEILCKNEVGMHDSEENHENWRDGMIFQSYESLWKVIHRINTEWEELCSRGFSLQVFYAYWHAFQYDRSMKCKRLEEEKLKAFMAVLDGKMKIIPLYQHIFEHVGFMLVSKDSTADEIIYPMESKSEKAYQVKEATTDR